MRGGPVVISNPVRVDAWREAQTQDGEVYYYNAATGESSWEIPAGANVIEIGGNAAKKSNATEVKKTFAACFLEEDEEGGTAQKRKRYTLSGEESQSTFRGPIIASIICGGVALVAVAFLFYLADQGVIEGNDVTGYLALVCSPLCLIPLALFLRAYLTFTLGEGDDSSVDDVYDVDRDLEMMKNPSARGVMVKACMDRNQRERALRRAAKKKAEANSSAAGWRCCYLTLFLLFAAVVSISVWFIASGRLEAYVDAQEKSTASSSLPGLELAGLGFNALYGTQSGRNVIKMDSFTLGKEYRDAVSSTVFKIPDSVQNVFREPSCKSAIDVQEYKTVDEYIKKHTLGFSVGVPLQAGALSLSPEISWTTQKMTETNGYVYEAKVECTEFRAALNTQPTPQEKQSWTRAYLLGLGIVLLVVAACIGLLLMYRTESSEFSKSRFCKYLLRGILGMTVLGGTTLCIYASMAILDTKYEAVVVVHESFMQTINSLPTEFKSSEGKAAWWSFFGNFGTHYYDSIVTGGKMQTNTIFDETFVKNRKAFEVKIAAKAAFGGVELGPSYGYTDEDVKTATENSKATKQFQEGGDATTFFTDGWEKWVSTIDEKPAIIDFKVKPLWNLVQDPTRQNLVRAATEEYLDYVGNAQNPGDSCTAIASAMRQKYDIPLNNGIHYVRDLAGKQSMVFCDFSQSVAGGGWTLAVNKLGGFTGNFQPALAWLAATSINKQRPGLSSDYKLDFETFFDEQKGVEVMLQFNADADKGARAYARLSPKKGWEHYTHPDTGSAGARHLISAFGTNANALSSSLGSLPSDTNHYLVLSYDGGICIVPENAAIESSAMGFSCDGDNGLNKGVGLFDATSANEFNNCETFAWKTVYGGEDPEEYWSDTCKAIGGSCNSKCSRGGTCLNSNGCVVHNSNTQGCGFLNMGCKPRCRLIKNSVSKCGTSFAPTDFVSLWFREGGAVHVDATSKEGGGN